MNKILTGLLAAAMAATTCLAQKVPQPKSQKEVDALMAIQNAEDPDKRIAAVENLLLKFADTEFKGFALMAATDAARMKNDYEKILLYGERTLEIDPKSYTAMLAMAAVIAQRTREHDLDREEKLSRAEKLAKQAVDLVKSAPKMNPQIPDDQWALMKKDFDAQGHDALGMVAMSRKKYDVAAAEFRQAADGSGDPASMVRLGTALNSSAKYDEAIAIFDKVMAMTDIHPAVKQVAQAERVRAIQAKGAK
ncbi:MAG: hypothetical protein HYZ37_01410 [Candidatus Solibacter usitatus]|nr:hypothetical protein [Candidatus Solibacter usitatus]